MQAMKIQFLSWPGVCNSRPGTNAFKVLYNRTGGCSLREATTKVSIKHFRTREGCSVREISNAISSLGGGCNARIRYFNNSCTFEDGEGGLWKMY